MVVQLDEFGWFDELGEPTRTVYAHNRSGVEETDVYPCACKVVYNRGHLPKHVHDRFTQGMFACPACDGFAAQIPASSYVFPCADHSQA